MLRTFKMPTLIAARIAGEMNDYWQTVLKFRVTNHECGEGEARIEWESSKVSNYDPDVLFIGMIRGMYHILSK